MITSLLEALGPRGLGAEVSGLVRLKGGYSRQMWSFDLVSGEGCRELILCLDEDASVVGQGSHSLSRVQEALLLESLHGAGLPVPAVLAFGDGSSPLGRPFLVMERLRGSAAVGPIHRDPRYVEARRTLARQLADMLYRIHSAPAVDALGPPPEPDAAFRLQLSIWENELCRTADARTPAFVRAAEWLAAHPPPPPERLGVVHGDFRTGNLLHLCDGEGAPRFMAVLDWEMAHMGDPLEDVAWATLICWRVGTDRVGGLVHLDEWSDMYSDVSGLPVDPDALRAWTVLGSLKMACLLHRAREALPAGSEKALLDRLYADLEGDLTIMLDAPFTRPDD